LGFLILGSACGKKAPPVPPKATVPPAVQDLEAEVLQGKVRLTWSIPKRDNAVFPGIERFGVFKHESESSTELCEECPIPFEHFMDISLKNPSPAHLEGDRVVLEDTLGPDRRYAYKVVVYHKSGGGSEDSNIVQFVTGP
jgi:hypothetical protein